MLQGVPLTKEERSVVLALAEEGLSLRKITSRINRGRDAVLRVIARGSIRERLRRRGVRRKLPKRCVRLMLRAARTENFTARELQVRYAPMVTVRRVQKLLAQEPTLQW